MDLHTGMFGEGKFRKQEWRETELIGKEEMVFHEIVADGSFSPVEAPISGMSLRTSHTKNGSLEHSSLCQCLYSLVEDCIWAGGLTCLPVWAVFASELARRVW